MTTPPTTATTTTATPPPPPHILVIPFPAQGHMIPLLDLTHKLATMNPNLTITIVTTPKNQTLLTPLLSSHSSSTIHPLILPFPNSNPSIPTGTENAKDTPKLVVPIMLSLSYLKTPLIHWFNSHPSPPNSIISDMFCGWTQNLATELNIKRLVFSPSGAFALSTMFFLWKHLPKPQNPKDPNEVVSFSTVPNCPNYPWWQVSPLFRNYLSGNKDAESFRDWFLANMASWGLVVNSFCELERPYLDHLRKELGHDRVWAVGPLLPEPGPEPNNALTSQRGGSSSVLINDVVSWLDQRREREVVYLCFGSMVVLTEEQTVAISSAVEKSGVHFVWSLKGEKEKEKDQGVDLLSGFEDRTAERGLVIRGWAPQVVILRHKAVGAFVTHCGWNSVLESVVAGVPMLAWPMSADQFVNETLLVEELKVAKKVCEGAGAVPDSDELALVLAELVTGSGLETSRALRMQNAAVEAIRDGGGSAKDLKRLLQEIANLL